MKLFFAVIMILLSMTLALSQQDEVAESSFKVDSCNTTTPVTFALGQKGLTSLKVNGFEAIAEPSYQGEFGNVTANFRRANGSVYSVYAGSAQSTQLDALNSVVTHRFSWGDVSLRYSSPCENQIRFDLDVLNRSEDSLTKLSAFLVILDFPEIPVGTNWSGTFPLIDFPRLAQPENGLPAIRINYGNYGAITFANDTYPRIATMFGNFINYNSDRRFSVSTSYSEKIAPGAHATYSGSIRAGLPSAGLADLAPDVIQRYAAELPQHAWPDRRPIGRVFLANSPSSTGGNPPENPRGWINLPSGTDIRTAAGLAAFRQMMLSKADDVIRNLRDMNAQGVIVWDIEGQEYPHMTSFVGDPTKMDLLAPEMNYMGPGDALVVADEFFNRIKTAGFAVGVCLRPQRFACANGTCAQLDNDKPEDLIAVKAAYAANRWGTSLYYVDSNVHPVYGSPIPGHRLFAPALAMHPQSLFMGEWEDQSYSGIGAPYYATTYDGVTFTTDIPRIVYPGAFGAIVPGDKPNGLTMNELRPEYLQGVKNGDVYLANIWFPSDEFALVKSITELGGSRPSITMNGPTEGQIIQAADGILLDVAASSPDRSITKVEFFTAGLKLGEVENEPFQLLWQTPSLGKHSLTARVTDSNGMQSVSAPVGIEVR
jgi:Bacterial Ig domain